MTATAPSATLPRLGSEAALVLVHLAVVAGFARVYAGSDYVGVLVGFTLAAHGLAIACRVCRLPTLAVLAVAVGGAALTSGWFLFPDTLTVGLPTRATWDAAGDALTVARASFAKVLAPAPVTPGFQLAAGLSLWASAWFADWAAFRLRATIEATAPAAVIFTFCALLGSGDHQVRSATLFAGAVLLFVAAHRALRAQLDQPWLGAAPAVGPRAILRGGAAVAVLVLVAGVVVGPKLPGATAEPVVTWRDGDAGEAPRVTVSPMVELNKRLVQQSNQVVFEVRATAPAYWRLTALDRFDGNLFSSQGDFSAAGSDLPSESSDLVTRRAITQEIEIQALSAIWAPTAYEAASLEDASDRLQWDEESGTLIVTKGQATSDGLTYTVVSQVPEFDPRVLRNASGEDPADLAERYESLPPDFPTLARDIAADVTAGATSRYDQAIALQDYFRNSFEYTLDVEPGHGDDALVAFLRSGSGYCEQFSGAFAAMARSLGIPSRVAVGFTPGDQDPEDPQRYVVRGKHAHAWPEVWFPDIGWVAFEPTPGRGMPGAEGYTGVAPQQAGNQPVPPGPDTTAVDAPTTTAPAGPTTTQPGTPTTQRADQAPVTTPLADTDDRSGGIPPWLVGLAAALAVVAAWILVLLLAPVLRRRLHPAADHDPVQRAWTRALAPVRWATGLRPDRAETHREFAGRVAVPLGGAAPPFERLADLVTGTAWSPLATSSEEASEAEALAETVAADVQAGETRATKLRRRLSWREAFDRP